MHSLSRPLIFCLAVLALAPAAVVAASNGRPAPAFDHAAPHDWINTEPLDWNGLRGKVVLLNVWTYGCSNCRGSLDWLKSLYAKYGGRGLEIIGVHSPEFDWEKPRSAVAQAVQRHGIEWPVVLDNEMHYWRALDNRYWPAFYVVDRQGRQVDYFFGETHKGDRRARALENLIESLLKAAGTPSR
jgi:thiol-disulfide isomerase/thioredoxin